MAQLSKTFQYFTIALLCSLVFLGVGIILGYLQSPSPELRPSPAPSLIRTEFQLTNAQGKTVTNQDFPGKWQLIFFGFTHCPDICPTALDKMALILEGLGQKSHKLQGIFITLDPERDTPSIAGEYASTFYPTLLGLSGSSNDIQKTAAAFRVYYSRVEQMDLPDGYGIDHSGYFYLVNPQGVFDRIFRWNDPAEDILTTLQKMLN